VVYAKTGSTKIEPPKVDWPTELAPSAPFTISYPVPEINRQRDAAVINTITVTADAGDAAGEQTSVTATVIVGSPPSGCLTKGSAGVADSYGHTSVSWGDGEWATVTGAAAQIAPSFFRLLCDGQPPIEVYRVNANFGGGSAQGDSKIFLYNVGVKPGVVLYTLAHELGHILGGRQASIWDEFRRQNIVGREGFLWTYPNDEVYSSTKVYEPGVRGASEGEDFAETMGAYPVWRFYAFSDSPTRKKLDYPHEYPLHYEFARHFVFGGGE